jgi:hypothetical protein
MKKLIPLLLLLGIILISGCEETELVSLSKTVAVDSANNIHIVWEGEAEKFESDTNIYYRKWDGNEWSKTKVISDETSGNNAPLILSDSPNNIYVIWTSLQGNHLLYRHYDGKDWSETIKLNNQTSWRSSASLDKNGLLHVAWEEGTLYYKKIDKNTVEDYRILDVDYKEIYSQPYWVELVVDSENKPHIFATIDSHGSFNELLEYVIEEKSYSTKNIPDMYFYLFTARIDSDDNIYLVNIPHAKNQVKYGRLEERKLKNNQVVTSGYGLSPVVEDSFGNLYHIKDVGNRNFYFDISYKISNASLNIRQKEEWSVDIPLSCDKGTILPVLSVDSSNKGSIVCIDDDKTSFVEIDYNYWLNKSSEKKPTRICDAEEPYNDYINVDFDLIKSDEGLPTDWRTRPNAKVTTSLDGFVKGHNVIHEWGHYFYDVHVEIFEFNSTENAKKHYENKININPGEVRETFPVRLEYPETKVKDCVIYDYVEDKHKMFVAYCHRNNVFVKYSGHSMKTDDDFSLMANVIDAKLKGCLPLK